MAIGQGSGAVMLREEDMRAMAQVYRDTASAAQNPELKRELTGRAERSARP